MKKHVRKKKDWHRQHEVEKLIEESLKRNKDKGPLFELEEEHTPTQGSQEKE